MVMVLEQNMVNEIAQIGRARSPHEACGLLLPTRIRGQQVIELPNHSPEPIDSVDIRGEDMISVLERLGLGDIDQSYLAGLTIWHTHPGGNLGPSTFDLQNRYYYTKNLVVTLYDDGRPPAATWF